MSYFKRLDTLCNDFCLWADLRKEQGLAVDARVATVSRFLAAEVERLKKMRLPKAVAEREADDLETIRSLRPKGPRRIPLRLSDPELRDRLAGAWYGRAAGCILGAPCEGLPQSAIRNLCLAYGIPYPVRAYWPLDAKPHQDRIRRHGRIRTPRTAFLGGGISSIPPDDDLAYTLLGLLVLEEYGPEFTSEDIGRTWLQHLPLAGTAEQVALTNLQAGMTPPQTATTCAMTDWIGADIRSDPWGYAAPGWTEKAAEFAWRDARVSHRGTGIHGEMYFSAVIAAAFAVNDPREAVALGLTQIPRNCRMAEAVRSALKRCEKDKNWEKTAVGILKKYEGMDRRHTLNNAELTIAGIHYGGRDFGKVIGLTVSGGHDTDCTGATAGSIVGAVLGRKRLPKKWAAPLGNRVYTYLTGKHHWRSDRIADRFARVAEQISASAASTL